MAKHLLEWVQRRAKGTPRAAGWVAMALCASACLVTDPLEVEPPTPAVVNHPVVIVEDSVTPRNWAPVQLTRTSTPPCTQTFEAKQVTDEDLGDQLAARWFIDCADVPSGTDWMSCEYESEEALYPVDGNPTSRIGPSRQFTITKPGLHIVKVLVSDGFVTAFPNVSAGSSLASYVWAVVVSSDCEGVTQ